MKAAAKPVSLYWAFLEADFSAFLTPKRWHWYQGFAYLQASKVGESLKIKAQSRYQKDAQRIGECNALNFGLRELAYTEIYWF